MSLQEEAAALQAAVCPEALAALVASYPAAEAITIRSNWQAIDPHFGEKVPKDRRQRVAYLAEREAQSRGDYNRGIARYNDLRTRGPDALSDYDVEISGSRDPMGAVRSALRLTVAHISFDLTMALRLGRELVQLEDELAAEDAMQFCLF